VAERKKPNSNHALMIALACGATIEAAARQVGISERAVYRRLEKPEFKREINQLRSEMIQRAAAMLTAAAMESVKTLLELQKPSVTAAVRLGAARAVLEMGVKLREVADLEQRIAALEQQLAGTPAAA
jgi:hypothetical protein